MGSLLMERIFQLTLERLLVAHVKWLPGVRLSHQTTCTVYIEDFEGWWMSDCLITSRDHTAVVNMQGHSLPQRSQHITKTPQNTLASLLNTQKPPNTGTLIDLGLVHLLLFRLLLFRLLLFHLNLFRLLINIWILRLDQLQYIIFYFDNHTIIDYLTALIVIGQASKYNEKIIFVFLPKKFNGRRNRIRRT